MADYLSMVLRYQQLTTDAHGQRLWQYREVPAQWQSTEVALVLCDVWDRHWCPTAETRLAELLPHMSELVRTLRERGALIIHAPSETMDFYANSQARHRALSAPSVPPPPVKHREDPPLPVSSVGGGCDAGHYTPAKVWMRQHPAITIDEDRDVVSDQGVEHLTVYAQRNIQHVLLMGVHTNMCILNRSFAIKQLVRWGISVALVRDLTDAMYDPALPPYVSHAQGTELVISYIEKFWCPTVAGELLLS
ncbi:MAG: isochorismatase [Chloroflexi bacterium]|nr:isochorismatase [Chloroflexota bacterium]